MKKNNLIDLLDGNVEIEQYGQIQSVHLNGIEIPIIQRDYAQGRENVEPIRKRFLESIFIHLIEDEEMEMDFVYGSIKTFINGNESRNVFLPLDGQQRLTTLFLLYWFIGNRELKDDELNELRKKLAKFSYSTRASARMFCEKLSTISLEGNDMQKIESAYWFHKSFNNDPTVMGMLNMLASIKQIYDEKEKNDLYPKLKNLCFYLLPLDGFDLTDELYIKMNARGKSLTDFENFKADLINWTKSDNNIEKEKFEELVTLGTIEVPWRLALASNFDNKWTDLFWAETKNNEKEEDKIVDLFFMRFINRFFLNQYIVSSKETAEKIEESNQFKFFYSEDENGGIKYDSFDNYSSLISFESIKKLEIVLNQLYEHKKEIINLIKPSWNTNEDWIFYDKGINQRQRIIFYATTVYLENNNFDKDKISSWLRVVWNLIIDPKLRSIPAMIGAMKYIKQLSENCLDIESFISTPDFPLFNDYVPFSDQIIQEHKKAVLIKSEPKWKNEIIIAEVHKLFQGNINFLLFEENSEINQFIKYRDCAIKLFEENDLKDTPNNYLWIRALLAQCDIINLPIDLSNGSFNNWGIIINNSLKNAMRKLLAELIECGGSIKDSLNKICSEYNINNNVAWVFPLVNWVGKNGETLLGNYSESRRIISYNYYGYEDEYVYLYNKTKWTEGNINLSSHRNLVVSKLLKFNSEIKMLEEWRSIEHVFFKGRNILLERTLKDFKIKYIVESSKIVVGIVLNVEFKDQFPSYKFTEEQEKIGWIFKIGHEFKSKDENEIDLMLQEIEKNIFDINYPESEISKIENQ
jgi:hypothetical protein